MGAGEWADPDALLTNWPTPPAGIARANLDGTDVDRSFISGVDAGRLAVDAGHIYWSGWFCEATCGVPSG